MMRTSILCVLGLASLLGGIAAGCGGQSNGGGGTDTNTNWLKHCETDTDCGGLACLCNRCTRACNVDVDCSGEREAASCVSEPEACSGGARICLALDSTAGAAGSSTTPEPVAPASDDVPVTPAPEDVLNACGRPVNGYYSLERICAELSPPCLAPSEAFADACGCGCTSVDAYPRRCRSECPFGDECGPVLGYSGLGFAETERLWSAMCPIPGMYEGSCSDGKRFLFYSNGFTGEVYYFDAVGELFLGLGNFTDSWDPQCGGQGYWPEPVLCDTPTVTRVFCGTGRTVGDTFDDLPWADGRPGDYPG